MCMSLSTYMYRTSHNVLQMHHCVISSFQSRQDVDFFLCVLGSKNNSSKLNGDATRETKEGGGELLKRPSIDKRLELVIHDSHIPYMLKVQYTSSFANRQKFLMHINLIALQIDNHFHTL